VLFSKHGLLVTGGMDKLIRLWNPHFSGKATGILKGHCAPILFLSISSEDSRIFSVSIDNTVKIWDVEDQCCLFTAEPKASGIHGEISACRYSAAVKSLYVSADDMAVLALKLSPRLHSRLTVSHNEAVTCCGFSQEFRQVVSCTEGSVVKVWDFDSGRQVFEFGGSKDLAPITCVTFDPKGRRLITGGTDGCLKIWNSNNGLCLKTLKRGPYCRAYVRAVFAAFPQDVPEDLHHVQRPLPSWQDDRNGHREDVLCVAQCPPSLLATGAYDGEIIVWNVVSGRVQCRFGSRHSSQRRDVEGDGESGTETRTKCDQIACDYSPLSVFLTDLDTSVPSLIFVKNLQEFSSTPGLLSSGSAGRSDQNALDPSQMPSPISFLASSFWSSLQIVDSDQVVLTSSADCTVRLWSARGKFIGTFGQQERWSVHLPSSWMHPAVPFEVLIDPLSLPDHEMLNVKTRRREQRATRPLPPCY
uniref:WD40 repeat domain 95 n=1 Tax=Salarias fasciatus TaxID=181472 RepID=A0A672J933_SALFA